MPRINQLGLYCPKYINWTILPKIYHLGIKCPKCTIWGENIPTRTTVTKIYQLGLYWTKYTSCCSPTFESHEQLFQKHK